MNKAVQLKIAIWSLLVLFLALSESVPALGSVLYVPQGWTKEDAEAQYEIDEGSQLIPLRWIKNLELKGSTQLLFDQMEKFGLIPHSTGYTSRTNNELPLGMTISESPSTEHLYNEKKWVGFNCTACHTSHITVSGVSLLIHGGQSLFEIQKFENAIIESVDATINEPEKFERFAKAIGTLNSAESKALKSYLELFKLEFGGWVERNHTSDEKTRSGALTGNRFANGPGRIDGLGGGTNDLICQMTSRMGNAFLTSLLTSKTNCKPAHAPTSIPHIWGSTKDQFVQWNGNVHSSLGRNFGQSTATYAKNWIESDGAGGARFKSTANVDSLFKLEKKYQTLRSPSWADLVAMGIASPIQQDKADRGAKIYQNQCLSCHALQPSSSAPNKFGNSYWLNPVVDIGTVGTSRQYIDDDHNRRAILPTLLRKPFTSRFGVDSVAPDGTVKAASFRSFVIGAQILEDFRARGLTPEQQAIVTNCRDSSFQQTVVGMRARTLDGVILTGPFLHNGSVPTIDDLLRPAADRPTKFWVGCTDYDLDRGGYSCQSSSPNAFLFDTEILGNGNEGHEYGTTLNASSRADLIEFLKTIQQPQDPSPINPSCH